MHLTFHFCFEELCTWVLPQVLGMLSWPPSCKPLHLSNLIEMRDVPGYDFRMVSIWNNESFIPSTPQNNIWVIFFFFSRIIFRIFFKYQSVSWECFRCYAVWTLIANCQEGWSHLISLESKDLHLGPHLLTILQTNGWRVHLLGNVILLLQLQFVMVTEGFDGSITQEEIKSKGNGF